MRRWVLTACLGMALSSIGCAPMRGSPSLSLLTRAVPPKGKAYQPISGPVEDTDCIHWVLLFVFGKSGSHEAIVRRMLKRHNADVLLDAEMKLSSFGLPYLYLQSCVRVTGTPARLVSGTVSTSGGS